jgi:ATP-dependent RNA helicase SUPV3L1/SUV3
VSPVAAPGSTLQALLGPTNTGKTHRAIERMLEHESGLFGLPLRLLAREVYDRVTARVGQGAVALVTGEEKRVPPRARYWICTVEAMPALEVDFLAVDEVQLAGHRERGHVFTDRLLHARGRRETWFLGAATMRPMIERLCPTAGFESRPRLSSLTDLGSVPLGTLPPRTAVVAFSATRVYELAQRVRIKRGGAAVVIGALSPRARNAQVALYQAGEVDYLVATDAIGMGLNLDLDCVAFAETRKFDGREARALDEAELAQIAGRAGRHHRDGRFCTLAPLPALQPGTVRALERHRFPPDQQVYWRSRDLDLRSTDALIATLKARPPEPYLVLKDDAEDFRALCSLARDTEVAARAQGPDRVALLWEVCQIPDFRQLALDDHFQLCKAVFLQLTGARGRIETDWMAVRLQRLDDVEADLETLLARMSAVRTWTYVTQHGRWVDDAADWQARAGAIEDRLSDALHQQLVARFVEVRGKRVSAGPRAGGTLAEQLAAKVIGEAVAVSPERWVDELVEAPPDRFTVDEEGRLGDGERPLARLARGADLLRPEVLLIEGSLGGLGAGARLRLGRRMLAVSRDLVAELLAPLQTTQPLGPAARGLLYQLEQGLGTALVGEPEQLDELGPEERSLFRRMGLVPGERVVYLPALLSPRALLLRWALCAAQLWPEVRLSRPSSDARFLERDPEVPAGVYTALGFPLRDGRPVRADLYERRRGAPERARRRGRT